MTIASEGPDVVKNETNLAGKEIQVARFAITVSRGTLGPALGGWYLLAEGPARRLGNGSDAR